MKESANPNPSNTTSPDTGPDASPTSTGSIAAVPVTAAALIGILITAALFLRALQRIFTGAVGGHSAGFTDLHHTEILSVGMLLVLSVAIGVFPRPLLEIIEPGADALIGLVGR